VASALRLLAQENGIVPGLLEKMSITPAAMQLAVERELERIPKVTGSVDTSKVYVTQAVNDVLTRGEEEAKSLKDDFSRWSTCCSDCSMSLSPRRSRSSSRASASTARKCSPC
jgi:ATP-dependent Clp protease ATP-binding subunit ClpA